MVIIRRTSGVVRGGPAKGRNIINAGSSRGQIKQGLRDSCKSLGFCSESTRGSWVVGVLGPCDLIFFYLLLDRFLCISV